MNNADRHRFLHAPYKAPPLKRGDRTTCLYRDRDVVITSWTDARISWPRCRVNKHRGGYPGLLVNYELLLAIRTESEVAISHWFGVSTGTVLKWRRAFGIKQWGTEGSRRLHKALSEAGAAVVRGQPLSAKEVEQRRRRAIKMNLAKNFRPGYQGRWWTKKEKALLGKHPDEKVAKRIGRAIEGVRLMRTRLGIPSAHDRRLKGQKQRRVS